MSLNLLFLTGVLGAVVEMSRISVFVFGEFIMKLLSVGGAGSLEWMTFVWVGNFWDEGDGVWPEERTAGRRRSK